MAPGMLPPAPPRLPRSTTPPFGPFGKSRARAVLLAAQPVTPTTWPSSLIAFANPSGSPGNGGSSWTCPCSQSTASTCKKKIEQGSCGEASAPPTIWPRLLISKAWPLLPPNRGSGVITPFCHTKGRQIRKVPVEHTSSPLGSGVEVFERPEIASLSLIPVPSLNGPPSVPRSVITPFCQRNASACMSPVSVERPATEPLLLIPLAWLNVPPSVGRTLTV